MKLIPTLPKTASAPGTRPRHRVPLWMTLLLALPALWLPTTVVAEDGIQQTLEGGIQIWLGETWGFVRADIGPRYSLGSLSVRPHASIGPSFLPGVAGTPPTSLGGYLDLDVAIPMGDRRFLQVGPGGGVTYIPGLHSAIDSHVIPQGFMQAAYRWEGNLIGLMLIAGPRYDWEHGQTAEPIWFSGVGLRFEYVVR